MRQELGDGTTTIATEGAELLVERVFDAPRELGDQVDRIGQILEAKPRLTIGTVTVGGHA